MTATNGAGAAGAVSASAKSRAAERGTCPCGVTLGLKNQHGLCRACRCRALSADPDVVARRSRAALATYKADATVRARHKAATRAAIAKRLEDPAAMERLRENGRKHGAPNFPLANTPEARGRAAAATRARHLGWCPPEYYGLNASLKAKGYGLAERKAIILADVPGTPEHARRTVANHQDAQRIRAEREKAQAY